MLETNYAARAALLRAASSGAGVRQLSKELHMSPAIVISLRREMSDSGLLEVCGAPVSGPGRPRELVRTTPLGRDYIEAYDKLRSTALKSRRADLQKAASDARYAMRLTSRGVSTVELFLGLNSIAERAGKAAR